MDATAVLSARSLVKRYGPVQALTDVSIEVRPSEIVALCGDNGAGKSTLVKILSGSVRPDSGSIEFDGQSASLGSPQAAFDLGIATVYQDLALCDNLDIFSNLFLGHEIVSGQGSGPLRRLKTAKMYRAAQDALSSLSITLPRLNTQISELSGGQRQAVAVGRALLWGSRLVLMDEPTAALGVEQTAQVLALAENLSARGVGVVLISHSLPDVFAVADRIVVLRLGRNAGDFDRRQVTPADVVSAITGGSTIAGAA